MNIGIVIPAYNEADSIARVIRDIVDLGQVIVVDDYSSDDTNRLAREAGATVLRHEQNQGYDGALQTGAAHAAELGLDAFATYDADGQHSASALREVIAALEDGKTELVIGQRQASARFSEALFSLYTRWRFGVRDILCGLKGYRMSLYQANGRFDGRRSIGTELALYGLRHHVAMRTVELTALPRQAGQARFGSVLRANLRILRAMLIAIRTDLFGGGTRGSISQAQRP